MLTFILGLTLGACLGAAAIGICSFSYEHQADDEADEAPHDAQAVSPGTRVRA